MRLFIITVLGSLTLLACSKKKTEMVWDVNFPRLGSESSLRAEDLNGDGIKDLILGAGENEYVETPQGILAIDGKNGSLLWQQEAKDLVFGSATFIDVTKDGISDIFIGGRQCIFKGIDGKTGSQLWAYDPAKYQEDSILGKAHLNFL
ncbi:MAG: FG-GAP repeat protein [Saprospiraceae bacterium]|nr:FG-GAP repeat protein [Saprospiraceae bacterium]